MPLSLDDFLTRLSSTEVLPHEKLRKLLDSVPPASKTDGEQLARELVRQKALTAYQAKEIYSGKGTGLVLGNYVIQDKLGQGGMGLVLKALHRRMERLVALKVLSPQVAKDPAAIARFHRELKAVAKLSHPNIVTAHDADEAKGVHFLVMEYVEGTDLASLVKQNGPLSVASAVNFVRQSAEGLAYAHEAGVIHRDIKPANLLVDKRGLVKVLDMGLARLDGLADDGLTNTGAVMGTVDYMSPEQAADTKHADARSDIYSLGVTLYYLLTGQPVFAGDTVVSKLLAHQNQLAPSLAAACPAAPAALDELFAKMLAKKPADRVQTMRELSAELAALGLPPDKPDSLVPQPERRTDTIVRPAAKCATACLTKANGSLLAAQERRHVFGPEKTSRVFNTSAGGARIRSAARTKWAS